MNIKFLIHWLYTAIKFILILAFGIGIITVINTWPAIGIGLAFSVIVGGISFIMAVETWNGS